MPEQTGEEPGLWTIPVLIRNSSELPPPEPAFETGVGEPRWKGLFHQALNDLRDRRIWIGTPSTDVFAEGPGVVQYFDSNLSLFGWGTVPFLINGLSLSPGRSGRRCGPPARVRSARTRLPPSGSRLRLPRRPRLSTRTPPEWN